MAQNRKKVIDLFIGNIANSIIHRILEKAIDDEAISNRYGKELNTSLEIALRYREKINPTNSPLPEKDIEYVKSRITNNVKAELALRISKGYSNIDLSLVEEFVEKALKDAVIL